MTESIRDTLKGVDEVHHINESNIENLFTVNCQEGAGEAIRDRLEGAGFEVDSMELCEDTVSGGKFVRIRGHK